MTKDLPDHKFLANYYNTKKNRYRRAADKVLEHFSCHRCGLCCEAPVGVTEKEVKKVAKFTKMRPSEFCKEYRGVLYFKHPCPFFGEDEEGNKACRIYPVRPEVCRLYPFDASRTILQAIDRCPMSMEINSWMKSNSGDVEKAARECIDSDLEEKVRRIMPDLKNLNPDKLREQNQEMDDQASEYINEIFPHLGPGTPVKNLQLMLEVVEGMAWILGGKKKKKRRKERQKGVR